MQTISASSAPALLRRQFVTLSRPLGRRAKATLLLAFGLLVAVKLPDVLLQGRFWAEEGSKFFPNAWQMPWWHALLAPWGGYLNITANLGGILAWHVAPLAWAPYASTLLAFAFQLCPAILVLTANDAWLQPRWVMLTALGLLLTVPAADEVWLSSIGTQCHLNLCAGIILALGARGGAVGACRLLLLALAVLSGPGTWVLTPLFTLRAALERTRPRAVQAIVLCLGVMLQVTLFYSRESSRSYAIRPGLFADIALSKHLFIPFFGMRLGQILSHALVRPDVAAEPAAWGLLLAGAIGMTVAVTLIRAQHPAPRWFVAAALPLAIAGYVGVLGNPAVMLDVTNGGRYAFAPQALIALAVLGLAATQEGAVGGVAAFLTAWLLLVGAGSFFLPVHPWYASGPSWRTELARHQADPAHVIRGWPAGWTVPLPPWRLDPGLPGAMSPMR